MVKITIFTIFGEISDFLCHMKRVIFTKSLFLTPPGTPPLNTGSDVTHEGSVFDPFWSKTDREGSFLDL